MPDNFLNLKQQGEFLRGTEQCDTELPEGMKAYKLTTPQSVYIAADFMTEFNRTNAETSQFYALCGKDNVPFMTMEIQNGNELCQCKGAKDISPEQLQATQQFVKENGFNLQADQKHLGLIQQDGQYYDLHNLPDGFVVKGNLDLSGMDLTGINLNIQVTGELNLSECTNLPEKIDLTKMNRVNLSHTDLKDKEMIMPTGSIDLSRCSLPKHLDFSKTREASLYGSILKDTEILMPTEKMDLSHCQNLPNNLDFSKTKEAILQYTDLENKTISMPTEFINLLACKNLPSELADALTQKGKYAHILSKADFENTQDAQEDAQAWNTLRQEHNQQPTSTAMQANPPKKSIKNFLKALAAWSFTDRNRSNGNDG